MRRVSAAAGAALTLFALAACGGGGSKGKPAASPPAPPARCPLTGQLPAGHQDVSRPVLAVKIDNVDIARPQAGIDRADIVIEETVEGGLTRLFTVFQCDSAPLIGPVRSARTSDASLLRLFGHAAFGFSGANPKALKPVQATSHAVLLSYDANGSLYHRDNSRPAPHNVFTSTQTLVDAAKKKDNSLKAPSPLFTYAAAVPAAAKPSTGVSLRWSPDASAAWSWSAGRWVRTQNGSPDVLVNHHRVGATNVILMRIKVKDTGIRDVVGNPSPDDVVTGSGQVWVLRDGKVITGRWKRAGLDAPIALVDSTGKTIPLAPGRTWIELLPPNATLHLS
ncbi:MAG TPA: DUF3048 domain-containing protein [Mycobacteriales bacterium]|nr:DUF3048 domain-containing protein [Mycobacteriales bacterium]